MNLAVVPLVAPAMAAGVVALLGGWLVGPGAPSSSARSSRRPAWVVLRLMIAIVDVGGLDPVGERGVRAGGRHRARGSSC